MKAAGRNIYNIIRTCIYLALAVVVLVFAHTFAQNLQYVVGAIIVFYGVEETLFNLFNCDKKFKLAAVYWNISEILIGVTLLALQGNENVELTCAIVCVCWATWSILRETRELLELTVEFKHKVTAIPNILESLVAIGFSIALIVNPTEHHAKMHLYLLVVELATKVLFPLVDKLYLVIKSKKTSEKIAQSTCDTHDCDTADTCLLSGENANEDGVELVASDAIENDVIDTKQG